jgi:hypothetical protein
MTRLVRLAMCVIASLGALIGFSSSASASTAVYYHSYTFFEACSSVGYDGAQHHTWVSYYCNTVFPSGPGYSYPGQYDLYVYYS